MQNHSIPPFELGQKLLPFRIPKADVQEMTNQLAHMLIMYTTNAEDYDGSLGMFHTVLYLEKLLKSLEIPEEVQHPLLN